MAEKKPIVNTEREMPAHTRARSSLYAKLVEDFMATEKHSGVVENVSTKMSSQYMGLRNAVKSLGFEDKVAVTRFASTGEVWLVRKDI